MLIIDNENRRNSPKLREVFIVNVDYMMQNMLMALNFEPSRFFAFEKEPARFET